MIDVKISMINHILKNLYAKKNNGRFILFIQNSIQVLKLASNQIDLIFLTIKKIKIKKNLVAITINKFYMDFNFKSNYLTYEFTAYIYLFLLS